VSNLGRACVVSRVFNLIHLQPRSDRDDSNNPWAGSHGCTDSGLLFRAP
jgi:hypothetical protein